MTIEPRSEEELDFNAWLASIKFVDKDSKLLSTVLTDDESDDPEEDRA